MATGKRVTLTSVWLATTNSKLHNSREYRTAEHEQSGRILLHSRYKARIYMLYDHFGKVSVRVRFDLVLACWLLWVLGSAFIFSDVPVRSPHKIIMFVMKNDIYRIKPFPKNCWTWAQDAR